MHFDMSTVLAAVALFASFVLIQTDRLFAIIALVASGVQFMLAVGLLSLSVAKLRMDVVLPALLVVSGAVCWYKLAGKYAVTAATAVALLGGLELVLALHLLH